MPHLTQITISPTLTFDALVTGEPGAPLVLLLHGFAESMHCWRAQVGALAAAGYRAVAPSQRGYSPGARPDTGDTASYPIDRLMDDAMAIVAACGYGDHRFHLVGHDWGGSIAWALADRFPERLASLTVLSRPHPNAFNRALQMPDGDQAHRSRHHKAFLEPGAADVVLADDAKWLRERLAAAGVPAVAIEEHPFVLGNKAAMEAALAWYRARGAIRSPLGPIRTPTLYIWGDADDTVGRTAAEGTKDFVAAPIASRCFPMSAISPRIRRPIASTNYCCCTSPRIPSNAIRSNVAPHAQCRETLCLLSWLCLWVVLLL
jgi:pimeloyl-ACP methyl ester carboxylesterase